MRTEADEAQSPKYAHVERERRWLVDADARPDVATLPFTLIEDRYLVGTYMRLRRMTNSGNGAQALKLTKKYEVVDPLARPIVTTYLTSAEYALFEPLSAHALTKRRYAMAHNGHMFSIDLFQGRLEGLELAEIEWPDDAGLRALPTPRWALREVSQDSHYQGGTLAQFGIPKE
jgi:CYTH domain-containing protein